MAGLGVSTEVEPSYDQSATPAGRFLNTRNQRLNKQPFGGPDHEIHYAICSGE